MYYPYALKVLTVTKMSWLTLLTTTVAKQNDIIRVI